ncbi:hypothetical protein EPO33_05460 [Patescibacteria group bacterium]|nr:MAG: hypothetical protein EPO33_05460 [Patescibacteria group bacterium]
MELRDQELLARFLDFDARLARMEDGQVRHAQLERLERLLEAALAILQRLEEERRQYRDQMGWVQSRLDRLEDQ